MKYLMFVFSFAISFSLHAQKPCEYSTNIKDSLGIYKSTKEYVVYERQFAGTSSYVFFSLVNTEGMPFLNLQCIQKSPDFIKAACFDSASRIFLQLMSGKIVTLIHTNDESCGSMVRIAEENKYSRILTGSFMFVKGSLEDLKASPVSLMRIKYSTETLDYVFKKELVSEMNQMTYQPESYFMNYLKCVE